MSGEPRATTSPRRCTPTVFENSRTLLVAFAVLWLGVLVGCGRPAADDGVALRLWGMGREGEVLAELVRDFEAENPGIRVRAQQIPWTAAHEKLLTAHVGDASPDVAVLGSTWVPEFVALEALDPLDNRIEASDAVARGDFFHGIWDTNRAGGSTYGVPLYVDTRLVFYRTDLLEAAGYDAVPDTWGEWRTAMQRIKEARPNRYAIFLPTNEWAPPVIFGMQKGSPLLRDGGRYGDFRGAAFRDAFEFYLDLYRSGLAPPVADRDVANPWQELGRGSFAMWITGPWNIGEFRSRLPAEMQTLWATAPLPGPEGRDSGISLAGGASLVIFRSSQHNEEAWKLVEFLSQPEQQLRFFEKTGSLPAASAAWQDPALAEDPHARAFRDQLERVRPLPAVPEIELIMSRVIDHAEAAVRGRVTAAEALAALDREVDQILEKRRWVLERELERGADLRSEARRRRGDGD